MPILNKAEVFPLTTYMAEKGGASTHKYNKAPGNLHFPGRGARTDPLTNGRNPERDQHQRNVLLQASLNLPFEPQSGKTQTPSGTCLGKGMKNSELGKTSLLHTPSLTTPLWSKAAQSQRQQEEHSLLPTWEQQQGDVAVHGISCLKPLTQKPLPPLAVGSPEAPNPAPAGNPGSEPPGEWRTRSHR